MSEVNEVFIEGSISPISIETTEIILDQMKNCVCKIHMKGKIGTGFFIQIPYNDKLLNLLITNYHILNGKDIMTDNIINISLNNEEIFKKMQIDSKRKKYISKKLDVTIIEIKAEDNINNFLFLDENIMNNDINDYNNIYKNESIYILNYIYGKDIKTSYGKLNYIKENKIIHKCNTDSGSSGSPIMLLKNNKIIGVHYAGSKNNNFNFGNLLKVPILEYIEINEKNRNYIISEINIDEDNVGKKIRILNSFEEFKRNRNTLIKEKDYYEYENEEEIKNNCEIKINNKINNFSYYYEFTKKGKYIIEYMFTNNLTKIDLMFSGCSSLTYIDLSNFNAQNVTNMYGMFNECESLKNINLSNINTQSVTNMSLMFFGCISLEDMDLSNINTQNVTDMSGMFSLCILLKNINLSNINTKNVRNMSGLFSGCKSLSNINLSKFNTESVTNMGWIFSNCRSLEKIDLSNFDTKYVTIMSEMFYECKSLKKLDLSNFDTQNVTDMKLMFYKCNSLTKINLLNFNTQKVSNMNMMFYGCKSLKKENIITKDKNILNQL